MQLDSQISHLADELVKKSRQHGMMIATAESCTAGLISAAITDVAGSSVVFDRGFVTYSNAAKQQMLGVDVQSIDHFGAVSEPVAKEMAFGALSNSMADLSVSVTGVAGPGGGSKDKPVGTVWFGVAQLGGAPRAFVRQFDPNASRQAIRAMTVLEALKALLEEF